MKKCLLVLIGLLLVSFSFLDAQVFNGDLTLATQAQVDAFSYTSVTGIIFISDIYSDITNLDHLSSLTSVGKNLLISRQNNLKNLNGLANLQSVSGVLAIDDCPLLTNLDGLANLQSVGGLEITGQFIGNSSLKNIDGLSNLTACKSVTIEHNDSLTNINILSKFSSFAGDVKIDDNAQLSDISGLANLTNVGGDLTVGNLAITNLDVLSQLTTVGHHLSIGGQSLANIDGLSNLISVGDIAVAQSSVTNLNAFSKITQVHFLTLETNSLLSNIDGLNHITQVLGGLFIEYEDALSNVNGLAGLTSISGRLEINHNYDLRDLDGLNNLTSVGFAIDITDNPLLTNFCGLYNLFNSGVTVPVAINHNGANTISIAAPPNLSVNTDQGVCGAVISAASIGTAKTVGCILPTVTVSHSDFPSGNIFPVGTTNIKWSGTDGAGDTATAVQTITVVDSQLPVITCPANVTVGCASEVPAVNISAVTATDNCSAVVTHVGDAITNQTCANRFTLTRTYKATDPSGNSSTCSQVITVKDTTPPQITGFSVSQSVLWPPNHTMRDITLSYSVSDNCVANLNATVSITSNEPVNGTGDGDTSPDWVIVDNHHIQLRAERAANGTGRIYTITVTVTDGCNAPASASAQVMVTHNITGPLSGKAFKIGSTVDFSGEFWDTPTNTHTAQWLIDGSTSVKGIVTEPTASKNGSVTGSYKFSSTGVYKLQMNITDQKGITSYANMNGDLEAIVVIYDPSGGYAAGGGWYASPVGSLLANPTLTGKVSFGFALNYFKNATYPKGETQFQFNDGGLEFNAVNFNYLAISGPKAQFKGSGKVTGDAASYNFLLTLIDGQALGGGGVDKIRMKIYNKNTNTVIYDTQPGASDAADPVTPVGSGSSMTIAGTGATGASNLANDTQLEPTSRNPKPANYILEQNHPNPFNPTTQIGYGLPVDAYVTLRVYNEIGQLVSELVNGNQSAGYKSVEFDARAVSSGIYFYKLDAVDLTNTTNVFSKVKEMLLMK